MPVPVGMAASRPSPPKSRLRWIKLRWIKRGVTLALLSVVLVVIGRQDGIETLPARAASADPGWLGLALLLPLVAVFAGVRRWQLLNDAEARVSGHVRLGFKDLLRSFLQGRFVGVFTPSTVGLDMYRLIDVARRTGDRAASARVIVAEKLYGLVALSLVTLVLLPFGIHRFFGTGGMLVAAGLGVGSLVGLFVLARPTVLLRFAPAALRPRLTRWAGALRSAPASPALVVRLLGLGVVSHAASSAVFVGTGLALGVSNPMELLMVGNAIVIATLVPISVGGVGVREGTAVALLAVVGVPAVDATLLALLGYVAIQPAALLGGLTMFARRSPAPEPQREPGRAAFVTSGGTLVAPL